MKVHPVADYFPMMPEEELDSLAEDIKQNGLIHPIIRDKEGQLIDGRNRLKACRMAGVEPRYEELNGQDPVAFIVSANLARRNMTKGQQAMAMAMIYPEPEKGGRGKKGKASETDGFSQTRLKVARAVLRLAKQYDGMKIVEMALADKLGLDEALFRLKAIDEKATSEKDEAQTISEALSQLRKAAPDLAEQVDRGKLTLGEAQAAFAERERVRAEAEKSATELVGRALAILTPLEKGKSAEKYGAEIAEKMNAKYWKSEIELTPRAIQVCADVLEAVASVLEEKTRA